MPADELDAAVRRLADLGLLAEEVVGSDVLYQAAHPLIGEVAYAELSASGRRRRLHADVAAALEAAGVEDPQRLAHHYRGAAWEADSNRALVVLMAAASSAEEVHADAEASGYLTAALALARIDHPDLVGELLEQTRRRTSESGPDRAGHCCMDRGCPRAASCRRLARRYPSVWLAGSR